MVLLVVHLLLGYRELRDSRYYQDEEMVRRLLGLKGLPDVATISRALAGADEASVAKLREENRQMVLARLRSLGLARATLDFDGSARRWSIERAVALSRGIAPSSLTFFLSNFCNVR